MAQKLSKQGKDLADCNSRLERCQRARSRCETQRRILLYVLVRAFAALFIGGMFYATAVRSRL
jgi:hypothetical protein